MFMIKKHTNREKLQLKKPNNLPYPGSVINGSQGGYLRMDPCS